MSKTKPSQIKWVISGQAIWFLENPSCNKGISLQEKHSWSNIRFIDDAILSFPLQNHKNLCFHDKVPMSIDYQNSETNATYNWLVAYQYNQDASQLLMLIASFCLCIRCLNFQQMYEMYECMKGKRKRIAILFMKRF